MTAPVLTAVRHVVEEYKRFLRTSYRFHDEHLKRQFEEHLQQVDVVVRGPLVTLTRDFRMGQPLRALAEEGVVHRDLLRAHWPFGEDRVYAHQERALRIGVAGRSFLVTTGTGSGKTECFLLPILDYCLKARRQERQGVRAILMYPMNALANDQLERLRRLLRGSGLPISFGL
ncbi:MAG: DEAD/DEAH box helicase [Candidatus Rokubacteria bacterium]|nr:DEAD/DEAH box helicase [Candidatus Rokubacteria bacterium]